MSGDVRFVRSAVRVYAALTRLLPSQLSDEYARDMVGDFREIVRAAYASGGVVRAGQSFGSAAWDVVRGGAHEWWVERFARRTGTVSGMRAERVSLGDEMLNWVQDVRLAARTLAQRPTFTATVVLTLALGIGASVAIFAVVDSTLLRPLPYAESGDIVRIRHHAPGLELPELENSPGTLALYAEHARSFSALASLTESQRNLGGGREPARVQVLQTTASLYDVLRVRPRLGRALVAADARPGAPPVAVLTHSGWVSHFGSAPDIIGRTVTLNDVTTEIVGVMPPGMTFPDPATAAWLPVDPDPRDGFGSFGATALARLAPGVALAAAQQELSALQTRIPELFPDVTLDFLQRVDWSVSVRTLRDVTVEDARTALWIVFGTVGFLLLVACASVANLFLVRAEARQREIGIRMALGATRTRVAATFLYESVLVGIAGGVWGTLAALFAVRALVAAGPPQLPRLEEISINTTVLAFAAALSIGAGMLFGMLPLARQMTQPMFGLVGASRGHTAGRERQRVRKLLIVTQIALALMLLTGSGLMLRSFQRLRAVDAGFTADNVTTMGISLGDYRGKAEAARITREILEQVRALPGVVSAGATNALPLDLTGGMNGGSFHIRSQPRADDAVPPVAMYAIVTDGFHETMQTRLLAGRNLTREDEEHNRPVVVVNETFARSFLGGAALGEHISFGGAADTAWHEVVGVVADVRTFRLRDDVRALAYLPVTTPITGARPTLMSIAARTDGDPNALAPLLRAIVQRVDPQVPLTTARTMQSITDDALAETSFTMMILCLAALVALVLGAVGLYGVIGYVVSQRTKEIGVRIALGAVPGSVRTMVLRQGLVLAGAGVAIGMIGAALLSRALDAVLFEVDSRDPATFLIVTSALLAVSALAAYLPARRASAVSPLEALRAE
ncbi:MAG TPA: ABC transporter permease [Longimicrobiales bacterium]|nr:ABC transporter permease [Longimicrobiales bacterium]